jgi:hypothetical protein
MGHPVPRTQWVWDTPTPCPQKQSPVDNCIEHLTPNEMRDWNYKWTVTSGLHLDSKGAAGPVALHNRLPALFGEAPKILPQYHPILHLQRGDAHLKSTLTRASTSNGTGRSRRQGRCHNAHLADGDAVAQGLPVYSDLTPSRGQKEGQ